MYDTRYKRYKMYLILSELTFKPCDATVPQNSSKWSQRITPPIILLKIKRMFPGLLYPCFLLPSVRS